MFETESTMTVAVQDDLGEVGLAHDWQNEVIPSDVALVMSALDAGAKATERRREPRSPFRSRAMLWLFNSHRAIQRGTVLFTRDVSGGGLGFITRQRLPLGSRGVVELPAAGGQTQRLQCTLVRCRELTRDWYEGSLVFCRQLVAFENS